MAQGTCPDLSFTTLQTSKINNSAMIADLRKISKVLKKVKERENQVCYGQVGDKEDYQIIGNCDVFYKWDEKVV